MWFSSQHICQQRTDWLFFFLAFVDSFCPGSFTRKLRVGVDVPLESEGKDHQQLQFLPKETAKETTLHLNLSQEYFWGWKTFLFSVTSSGEKK